MPLLRVIGYNFNTNTFQTNSQGMSRVLALRETSKCHKKVCIIIPLYEMICFLLKKLQHWQHLAHLFESSAKFQYPLVFFNTNLLRPN